MLRAGIFFVFNHFVSPVCYQVTILSIYHILKRLQVYFGVVWSTPARSIPNEKSGKVR
jgi:hypothetical protein